MWTLLLLELIGFSFCEILDFYYIREGDILERKSIPDMTGSALASHDFRWPNAIVPYEISPQVPYQTKTTIREIMDGIEEKTCVRFREATESDYDLIGIISEGECASFVGRQGGIQDLSIHWRCDGRNAILHQLMHALGFVHEHTRFDRDEYIQVNWENIQEDKKCDILIFERNPLALFKSEVYQLECRLDIFDKRKVENPTLMDTPYSYNSIMHYTNDAFTKYRGYRTIVPKKQADNMGGGKELSDIDVERIRKLYCSDELAPSPSTTIEGLDFQQGNGEVMWANGCDFYANNIDQKPTEAKNCGDYCSRNPKCSHFTWNPSNGGVCYLKAGFAPNAKPHAAEWDYVCGYRGTSRSEGSWKQGEQGVGLHISPAFKWPNATVPYQIKDVFSKSGNQTIREAMREIEEKTCVKFRETRESKDRIEIQESSNSGSFVGRQGGRQAFFLPDFLMNIVGDHDETKQTILARFDRDEYIQVNWENIQEDKKCDILIFERNPLALFKSEDYYKKRPREDLILMDTPYSYDSIMHAIPFDFNKEMGQETFYTLKEGINIGGGDHLSDIDVTRIQKLYCA